MIVIVVMQMIMMMINSVYNDCSDVFTHLTIIWVENCHFPIFPSHPHHPLISYTILLLPAAISVIKLFLSPIYILYEPPIYPGEEVTGRAVSTGGGRASASLSPMGSPGRKPGTLALADQLPGLMRSGATARYCHHPLLLLHLLLLTLRRVRAQPFCPTVRL